MVMATTKLRKIATECPRCHSNHLEQVLLPETEVHYGKLMCLEPDCGWFIQWLPFPENEKKRKVTTNCKDVVYDFCHICGLEKPRLGKRETLLPHHMVPLSEGGKDELENILVVCTACHAMIAWLLTYRNRHQRCSSDEDIPLGIPKDDHHT
jgi:5-methylcytosine-specific restriction endonuclease McrA